MIINELSLQSLYWPGCLRRTLRQIEEEESTKFLNSFEFMIIVFVCVKSVINRFEDLFDQLIRNLMGIFIELMWIFIGKRTFYIREVC